MTPVEVRKLIIANKEGGMSNDEISRVFKVSKSAIKDISRKYRERSTLEGNYPGRQPKITEEQKREMFELVERQPDITIEEIIEELNLPIKKSGVSKILYGYPIFTAE